MSKVLIIGGGAAGMLAAIASALNGNEVHLFEKNEKLGKKLFITGKGRCNITNACDIEALFENVISNPKFLYSAFYTFHNYDIINLFERLGVKTKVERGNRVFPVSDKSSDVISALSKELKRLQVQIHFKSRITGIGTQDGAFHHICVEHEGNITGDALIIATGGFSYQTTGSTGDGYKFAKELGHKVTELSPALVPLSIKESFAKELQGLSLKNVTASIFAGSKELYHDFGEMLFTHYGVSGPLILSASSLITKQLKKSSLLLQIDLKPALSYEQLDARILREFEASRNKEFKNSINELLPKKLIPVMISYCGIAPEKKVNEITKNERAHLVKCLKEFQMTIDGLRDYNEAIITQGGIFVKEVNPATMESKLVNGVYFAGEVLDLDALTGGFNLQIAWSTAYLAGISIK